MSRKLSILYAEDQRLYAETLSAIIEEGGHVVEVAENGQAAMTRIEDGSSFDLVITDHDMPKKNGLDLVKYLNAQRFPGKVIVYSARVDVSVEAQYRALGVEHILTKQAPLTTILLVVDTLIAKTDTPRATG